MTVTPEPGPVIIIGLKEIYDILVGLRTEVASVSSQNMGLLKDMAYLARQQEDQDKRLRALESNRWPIPMVSILLALAGIVVSIVAVVSR